MPPSLDWKGGKSVRNLRNDLWLAIEFDRTAWRDEFEPRVTFGDLLGAFVFHVFQAHPRRAERLRLVQAWMDLSDEERRELIASFLPIETPQSPARKKRKRSTPDP